MVQQVLARLREVELFDRAVIVVAADHGIAFQEGARYRSTTRATLDEIAPVPLFIRAPGEPGGQVVDAPVELIDLLPTIADLLGAEIPWPVKGRPAGRVDPSRPRTRAMIDEGGGVLEFDDRFLAERSARRHAALIGAGGWDEVWRIGPLPKLVFEEVSSLRVAGRSATKVRWRTDTELASADPRADFLPALVTVELEPPAAANLVLVLNGRVAATVAFSPEQPGPAKALLPPALFTRGGNRLQFLVGDLQAGAPLLAADGEEVVR
jgi:hypothetical protein